MVFEPGEGESLRQPPLHASIVSAITPCRMKWHRQCYQTPSSTPAPTTTTKRSRHTNTNKHVPTKKVSTMSSTLCRSNPPKQSKSKSLRQVKNHLDILVGRRQGAAQGLLPHFPHLLLPLRRRRGFRDRFLRPTQSGTGTSVVPRSGRTFQGTEAPAPELGRPGEVPHRPGRQRLLLLEEGGGLGMHLTHAENHQLGVRLTHRENHQSGVR